MVNLASPMSRRRSRPGDRVQVFDAGIARAERSFAKASRRFDRRSWASRRHTVFSAAEVLASREEACAGAPVVLGGPHASILTDETLGERASHCRAGGGGHHGWRADGCLESGAT